MKLQQALPVKKGLLIFLFIPFIISISSAQVKYHSKDYVNLLVSGTSMLHDWDMKSAKGTCTAVFAFNTKGELTGLSTMKFVTPAESLKSGHSGMDKNTYNALKTNKYSNITFVLITASVGTDSIIKCNGKLTIAGVTNDADLTATYKINPDKSITISGTKKLKMSDFKMDPPTFMMGTIKTGNDVTFKFDLTLSR